MHVVVRLLFWVCGGGVCHVVDLLPDGGGGGGPVRFAQACG